MHCDVTLIRAQLAISYVDGEHADSPLLLESSPSYTFHPGFMHMHTGIKRVRLVPLAYRERRDVGKSFCDTGSSK
jgi:hypothetical protein